MGTDLATPIAAKPSTTRESMHPQPPKVDLLEEKGGPRNETHTL